MQFTTQTWMSLILAIFFLQNELKRLKVKGRFMRPFSTAAIGLLYSYPDNFPHSSPVAPRTIQVRGTSTSEGGTYYQ